MSKKEGKNKRERERKKEVRNLKKIEKERGRQAEREREWETEMQTDVLHSGNDKDGERKMEDKGIDRQNRNKRRQ